MHLVGVKMKQTKKTRPNGSVRQKKISANNDELIYPAESLNAQGYVEAHGEKTD